VRGGGGDVEAWAEPASEAGQDRVTSKENDLTPVTPWSAQNIMTMSVVELTALLKHVHEQVGSVLMVK
jgi:hypothetical protein